MSDTEQSNILDALAESNKGPSPSDLRIIERCREMAVGSLSGALKGMLDRLTDDFFTLAEKAVQIEIQHLYLEAMTVARDKRSVIEHGFRLHFIRNFNAAVRGEQSKHSGSNDDADNEFGLVAPDELEESIAIQEMSAKLKGNCREGLFGMDKRMGVLLHDPDLESHKNPLGSDVLANAFLEACRETEASLKVRLLFVTMWDKHMQNGAVSMYQEVNQYLVEKGILPKIKREIKRQGMSQAAEIMAAAAEAMAVSEDEGELFSTMQHLMSAAMARGTLPGMTQGAYALPGMPTGGMAQGMAIGGVPDGMAAGMPGGMAGGLAGGMPSGAPGMAAGAVLAHNPIVVTQLTQLQHGDAGVFGAGVAVDPAALVAGNVSILRDLKHTELGASLGSVDAMTIDIVAMLFDFIFEDKQVPDPIKALMGRLQIPVLKAAMLDQAFFSKKSHPTRRLLNIVAEAAIGWDETIGHESPLYQKVESIVQRILDEFEDNLAVFERALDDFERFLEEQERAADALVEVSVELIETREREQIKTEDAQNAAEESVRARAADIEVPDTVRLFLCQEWIKPLRAAYQQGGAESSAWLEAVGLMDDLIWSVRPKLSRESRQYMVKTLPALLRRLQEGMAKAEIGQETRDQFMSQLVKCHAAAVKAGFNPPVEPQPASEDAWKTAVLARQAMQKQEAAESAVVLPFVRPESAKDRREVKLEIIKSNADDAKLEVEEITIGSVGWMEQEDIDAQSDALMPIEASSEFDVVDEVEAKHLVDELKPGVWVEFSHQGEDTLQAKLKWISPLKNAYLFTDRQGKRAATMPHDKLEAAFRIGSARIIDDLPLLDRAVDNVLESLKQAAA
ncbi:MAG: DUF1631 domain-containing protein [Hydrogenophilales bacterium]|nr:DUF1631 domain-containing protein [Hydrogenophilales bacterium]